jgi:hypothetical protein
MHESPVLTSSRAQERPTSRGNEDVFGARVRLPT